MKRIAKRIFGVLLVMVMLMTVAPLEGFVTKASAAGGYRVGDTLQFGEYPQTTVTNDYLRARLAEQSYDSNGILYYQGDKYIRIDSEYYGMLPITWRVLSVDSDGLYIMADKILDCQPYNTSYYASVTWAYCKLRTWLNGYFYNLAFSDTEKQKINTTHLVNGDNPWYGTDGGIDTYDKVFVPSVGDVLNTASGFSSYGTEDSARFAKVTPYAQVKGAYVYASYGSTYNGNGYWWLRTPGYNSIYACFVISDGSFNSSGYNVSRDSIGVRPALKINLSSSIYQSKSYNSYEIKTVDGTTGKPLSGVSVVYDGNSVGTTKSDGTYTLSAGKNTDSNKEVKFVKGEYSSSSRKLYEMNPYGQNIIAMNSGFDVSGVLSDIALTGEKIDGPTVNIMGKSFPLFSFDGGLDFGSFSFKYNQNTKDKTVKYIVGIKDGIEISNDDDFNDNYDEFKSFFKGFSDDTNYKNYWRYNNIKNKLETQKGKVGFDANLAVAGYLEFDYSTGNLKFKEGGIVVTADAAVSQDVPFWGICYATFKIGGEIEGKLYATQENSGVLQLNTSLALSVKPTIGAGAKLLSKDIASVEVGINGKITGKIKLPASSFKESASLYLNANAYVKVKALWAFEHKWSTNFPNMNICPNFGEFQTSSVGNNYIDENGNIVTIDEDDLELIDRSYLDVFKTASYSGNDYLNDTAVYPYGYPELVKLDDGRIVALYLYDNGLKSAINRTTLYYSVYNNNEWSLPIPVCDSGLADFPAKVCTDGNKIYMVWQRASEVLNDKYEVSDIVDKTELVYSEFDGSTWSAPITVDTAGKYQMLYSIAESNGKVAVEWAENSVDSYTLSEGVTSVYYKTLEDDTWSSQSNVASSKGIAAAAIGFVGDNIKVAYSIDSDGDLTTANDSDIYFNGTQFTDNNVDEGEITYQNDKFYWIQGGELSEYDGYSVKNTGLYIENDYRVLNNSSTTAVTSLATDGFKNELVVSYLNGDTYTKPVALTSYGRHIGYYDAILNSNGSISVLADVDNLSNDKDAYPYTTTDMVCDIISGKTDLEICDVFAGDGVARGSTVTFSGTVKNNGTTPVSGYSVTLKGANGSTLVSKPIYSTILPGESKNISVDYTLPNDFAKQNIKAVVEADGDSVSANNSQTVTVGYADIQIVDAVIDRSGEITATVVNNGLEAVSNAKVKYVYSGANADTTLSNITVGSIGIGEVKTVTYSVPAQYLSFADNYSVNKFRLEAMSDGEEEALANNEYDVIYAPIAVEGITLNTSTLSLEYGQTAQLVATVYPSNAYNKGVHFVSDSTDVATVDDNGNITTVGNGTAIITAITDDGDYIAQCQVTVSVKVTSVDLDQKNITVNVGNTITINADVTPDAASDKTVKWTSSDNTIATVDDNGTVRGVKTGTATITAKTNDGGFEACCTVNVINAVNGITISDRNITLYANKTKQLKAAVTPADADNQSIVWESNDDDVATVSSTGLVTAKMPGTAIITVKSVDGGYTATCTVTVGKHVTSIILSDTELSMPASTSDTLYATVMPLSAFDKTVTWVSTNPKAATVDQNGNVHAVKAGTTTIIAYCEDGDVTAECTITVTNSATGIEMSQSEVYIARNSSKQLYATVIPDTAENANVTWESKYPEIATVDSNGVVTAKMAGTTMIVATSVDGGYKAYCSVKVVGIEAVSTASIDFDTGIITGLSSNINSLDDYIELTDSSCELKYETLGTDSIVYLTRDNEIIDAYTVVIFGDVNGDGWYDGMDSMIVNCLANGMMTKDDVGEAIYMAADCNHDGVIDQLDVDILREAGVLLSQVDQNKTEEELLETSFAYVEYLNLIDQTVETKAEEPAEDEPIDTGFTFNIFEVLIKLIKNLICNRQTYERRHMKKPAEMA
ncbi:MAG: Ig-like domain-containing protein, partial [Clostridia bacterium]|nr:Ig-like domain-containing protein [Clostridia bacterium]